MFETVKTKTEFEGDKLEELIIEFYDLMEKEKIDDTVENRKKLFGMFLENKRGELSPQEEEYLERAVILKGTEIHKKPKQTIKTRRPHRAWTD